MEMFTDEPGTITGLNNRESCLTLVESNTVQMYRAGRKCLRKDLFFLTLLYHRASAFVFPLVEFQLFVL